MFVYNDFFVMFFTFFFFSLAMTGYGYFIRFYFVFVIAGVWKGGGEVKGRKTKWTNEAMAG